MAARLNVTKTYKLFINGCFPRTESGRSLRVLDAGDQVLAHICHASRKDLRDAVEAARAAQSGWAAASAYNRGQVMYRMAEMMEGKREEFAQGIKATTETAIAAARKEVDAAIDRLVAFAGWADKFSQVLGCHNPVASPHYNFTVPEPSGVVVVVAPDGPALLGLITLIAAPMCAGNAVVAVASDMHPLPAAMLGEVCATSDVPAGVLNILTGQRAELLEPIALHREVDAVSTANLSDDQHHTLRLGAGENVKRVSCAQYDDERWWDEDVCASPWMIEPFIELKTIWHPSAV